MPFEMSSVVFGESTISRTQIQLPYNRFKEGREDAHDNAHLDRPNKSITNENIVPLRKMINDWIGI